jgi:Rha family phage regulatory protein
VLRDRRTNELVAERFGEAHKTVLRNIDQLSEFDEDFQRHNFVPLIRVVEVGNGSKKKLPYYEMTRDGFMMLVTGFMGKNDERFKPPNLRRFL